MKWPFESRIPPFLTNFNFENEADQLLYKHLAEQTPHLAQVQRLKEIETKGEAPDDDEVKKLLQIYHKEAIAAAELELFVMILDLKMSLIADHVPEPYPGYYEYVGLSPKWEGHRKKEERQKQLQAELKAQFRVIKGGLE